MASSAEIVVASTETAESNVVKITAATSEGEPEKVTMTTAAEGLVALEKAVAVDTTAEGPTKDVVRDIAEIIEFATARLQQFKTATISAEHYGPASAKLKDLRSVIDSFDKLLERSNTALLDEKAQLMKRLQEIQRAMGPVDTTLSHPSEKKTKGQSWADITEQDDARPGSEMGDSRMRRGNSPVDTNGFETQKKKSRGYNSRGRQRGGQSVVRLSSSTIRDNEDSSQDESTESPARIAKIHTREPKLLKKPPRPHGSQIPPMSAKPMMRRVILDDIDGFALIVKQDPKYGCLVTFAPPFDNLFVGGAITITANRPVGKPNVCEPLLLEGTCNCNTNALVLHAGKPLQIAVVDFVAILHKFVNNYSGNLFHPHGSARNTIDASILRCVVHAIVEIKGIRAGALTIGSFSDATDPINLLNAICDYYHDRKDINPMSVARGLFVAVATHFISS